MDMDIMCQHNSRQFSHEIETEHGKAYQYVCHDCQDGFISFIPPSREDMVDEDTFPSQDVDWEDYELDREMDKRYF